MSIVDQLFGAPDSVEAWERRARVRSLLLAEATKKMLDAAHLDFGSRVLDVGTGTGDIALMAAERVGPGGHVLAIDASPAMVDQAMNKVRKAGLDHVDVRLMDGARLDVNDASVDAVIGRNAMQFLPGWPEPLNGFHRVLRPGGRLAFVVWAPKELNPFFQLPISVAQQHGFSRVPAATFETPYSLASADQLHADLEAAGFHGSAVEQVANDVRLADDAALLSYLRDGPMFRRTYDELDHGERPAFDRALETALERFREAEGYRVQSTSLLATATR